MENLDIVVFIVKVVLTFKKEVSIRDLNTVIEIINKRLPKRYLRLDRDIIFYHRELCTHDSMRRIITRSDSFIKPDLIYAKDILFKNDDYKIVIAEVFSYFNIPASRIQVLYKKHLTICICGSMRASKEMVAIKKELESCRYEAILPEFVSDYAELDVDKMHSESAKNKIKFNLIKIYFETIKLSDMILVVNPKIKDVENYIGANTFLEMGFAHVLDKDIYILYNIQEDSIYKDEITAMKPKVLMGDVSLIE